MDKAAAMYQIVLISTPWTQLEASMCRSPLILNLFVNCSSRLMNNVRQNKTLISKHCSSHRVPTQIGVLADLKSTLLLHDYILIAQKSFIRKALLCLP